MGSIWRGWRSCYHPTANRVSWRSMSMQVRAQVSRTGWRLLLVIAFVLAAVILSIGSPSRASAASAAFVQGRNAQVTSGTKASLAFSKANTAGNLIVAYVVWDNPGAVTVSDTRGNTYTAATARQNWGEQLECPGLLCLGYQRGSNTVTATSVRRSSHSASCTCTSTRVSRPFLLSTSVRLPPVVRRP